MNLLEPNKTRPPNDPRIRELTLGGGDHALTWSEGAGGDRELFFELRA